MRLPIVTPGQLRVLTALAGGARLSRSIRDTWLLRRGRHVRGIRGANVRRLHNLILIRRGRITDAGRLVLALESR
jgi:hypothetical protein